MPKKLNLLRIAAHDFNRSLRVWIKFYSATEIFTSLINERAIAARALFRCFLMAIAGALWLSANKPDLLIQWEFLEFSIPVAYVNLAVAMLVFGTLINMMNFFILNDFIRIAANKLFKFDSAWALIILQDGSNAWSLGSVTQFRFLSSSKAHKVFGTFSAGMLGAPFVVVLVIIYWTVLTVGITVLRKEGFLSTGGAFTFLAWSLATFPLAYIAIISFPFSFERNTDFIRWNFLTPLYRRSGLWPPSAGRWLK